MNHNTTESLVRSLETFISFFRDNVQFFKFFFYFLVVELVASCKPFTEILRIHSVEADKSQFTCQLF